MMYLFMLWNVLHQMGIEAFWWNNVAPAQDRQKHFPFFTTNPSTLLALYCTFIHLRYSPSYPYTQKLTVIHYIG